MGIGQVRFHCLVRHSCVLRSRFRPRPRAGGGPGLAWSRMGGGRSERRTSRWSECRGARGRRGCSRVSRARSPASLSLVVRRLRARDDEQHDRRDCWSGARTGQRRWLTGGSLARFGREHGLRWSEGLGQERLEWVGRAVPGMPNQALERTAAPPLRLGSDGRPEAFGAGGGGGRAAVAQLGR